MSNAITRTFAGILLGAALTVLALEGVLRLLPIQDGLFAGDPSAAWQVHHLIANGHYTFSDAWDLRNVHRGVTNNMGYVAPFDYVPGAKGVVVVGDSFIESVMNRYEDTLQGQLAQTLRAAPTVLNFGTAGASLPDYIGLGPMVASRFRPRWVVILVVGGDFAEGFAPGPGFFKWSTEQTPPVRLIPQPTPGPRTKLLRTLAIVRYTKGNLKLNLPHLLHTSIRGGGSESCTVGALQPGDSDLIQRYVDDLPAAYGVPASNVILIFDGDRQELYRTFGASAVSACPTRDSVARAALAAAARVRGEHVIEMGPVFTAYFRRTGERVDYSPVDWHWNAVGHRLAATEVAGVIDAAATQ